MDALTLQVNKIKSLLTTILKGKAKEMDPEDMILEPPKVGGSKVSVSKMSKKKPACRLRSTSKSSRSVSEGSEQSVGALLLLLHLLPSVPLTFPRTTGIHLF